MSRIGPDEVQSMVSHWLGCPPNGYFGSLYGSDIRAMLQAPQRSGLRNDFVAKMRRDVPILTAIPDGQIDIGITDTGPDRRDIVIGIGSEFVVESKGRGVSPARSLVRSQSRPIGFDDFLQSSVVPSDLPYTPIPYGGLLLLFGGRIVVEGINGVAVPMTLPPGTWFTGMTPRRIRPVGTDEGLDARALTHPLVTTMRVRSGNAGVVVSPSDSVPLEYPAIGGVYTADGGLMTFVDDAGVTRTVTLAPDTWYSDYVITRVKATGTDAHSIIAFVRLPTSPDDSAYA